jgi:beta-glucanase (GH16 family)
MKLASTILRLGLATCALFPAAACAADSHAPLSGTAKPEDAISETIPFDPARWNLVWADEFDQPGRPDPATWGYEEGHLRNNEAQFYRPENARVEDGRLIIEARLDEAAEHPITSASLKTEGKRSFLYGRIAIRAKLPTGRGTWPALWTMGTNLRKVNWPLCGEIDIVENVGYDPKQIHANVHTDAYNHLKKNNRGRRIDGGEPWADFHEYAVEWYPDRLEFFYDDTRYFTFRKESDDPAVWPFAEPHFILMNLAIGGHWGGLKGIDKTLFPHRFEIDYVRHYQLKQPEGTASVPVQQ